MLSAPGVTTGAAGTALAAVAALLFALGTVMQHEVASTSAVDGAPQVRRLVRHPVWLLGQVAAAVGSALHVVALGLAPVAVVQPMLALVLVLALGIRSVWDRRLPTTGQLFGAACTAVGLTVFLLAARPAAGGHDALPEPLAVLATAAAAVVLVLLTSRFGRGAPGAVACGAAAGIALGVAAPLISAALQIFADQGFFAALTSASAWGALVAGLAGIYGTQHAFARGSLSWGLPALTVVDPVAAVLAAVLLVGERLEQGHVWVWLPGAVAAVIGVIVLARTEAEPPRVSTTAAASGTLEASSGGQADPADREDTGR